MKNILAKVMTVLTAIAICLFVTTIDYLIEQEWLFLVVMSILILIGALYFLAPKDFLADLLRRLFNNDDV